MFTPAQSGPRGTRPSEKCLVPLFGGHQFEQTFMNTSFLGRVVRRLLVSLLSIALLAVGGGSAFAANDTNTVSAASILKELVGYGKPQTATLLAFVSREDDRPWYVDDALLVLQLRKGQWVLVHAVRNPRYPKNHKASSTAWLLHHVYDAPHVGDRYFDHRPTRPEVDQFLKENNWQFESDKLWRVVKRVVDEKAWQRVVGYKPVIRDAP
jgi:hypothetical protein